MCMHAASSCPFHCNNGSEADTVCGLVSSLIRASLIRRSFVSPSSVSHLVSPGAMSSVKPRCNPEVLDVGRLGEGM